MKKNCPLQCPRLYGGVAEHAAGDEVDWAGLPVNLDFAFSRDQRDKVYAQHQHLKRRHGTQFGTWRRGSQVCVCELASESVSSG
ncbi:hypothetical protein MLM_1804 [Mycobacterium lepraemurium]|nr:hypothetical protein [Mycobacterium lepraemurium]ATA28363.1 hypothetical protein MLM_1804 [Mycobacterium lepraemurium]